MTRFGEGGNQAGEGVPVRGRGRTMMVAGVSVVESTTVGRSTAAWTSLRWMSWAIVLAAAHVACLGEQPEGVVAVVVDATLLLLGIGVGLWASGYLVGHGLTLVGLGLLPLALAAGSGLRRFWTSDVPVVAVVGGAVVVLITFALTRRPVVEELAERSTLASRNFYLLLLATLGALLLRMMPQHAPVASSGSGNPLMDFVRQSDRLNEIARLQGALGVTALTLALQAIVSAIPSFRADRPTPLLLPALVRVPTSPGLFIVYWTAMALAAAVLTPIIAGVVPPMITNGLRTADETFHLVDVLLNAVYPLAGLLLLPCALLLALPLRRYIRGWQRWALVVCVTPFITHALTNLVWELPAVIGDPSSETWTTVSFLARGLAGLIGALLITAWIGPILTRKWAALAIFALIGVVTAALFQWLEPMFYEWAVNASPIDPTTHAGRTIAILLYELSRQSIAIPAAAATGAAMYFCLRRFGRRGHDQAGLDAETGRTSLA